MSSFSDALEISVLDHVFHNTNTFTKPADIYMELYTVAPTDAGGGTVVTGGTYARQIVPFATGAAAGAISNTTAVTFTASGSAYSGPVIAIGLFDAVSAGNFLAWDAITSATVGDGDTLNFAVGAVDITLD